MIACRECKFRDAPSSTCRRRAPIVVANTHSEYDEGNWNRPPDIATSFETRWPEVADGEGCGEGEPVGGFNRAKSPSLVLSADDQATRAEDWKPVPRLPDGEFDLTQAGRFLRVIP